MVHDPGLARPAEHDQFSPRESLTLITEQSADALRSLYPSPVPVLVAWGLSWVVGFGAFYLAIRGRAAGGRGRGVCAEPTLTPASHPGLADLPVLDPVIHSQPRLRVVVVLAAIGEQDQIAFPRLQELVGMTAGNLATHLRKLEDAGYLTVTKTHRRRISVTYLSLTRAGRRAFEDYTTALHALLGVPAAKPPKEDQP